MRGNYEEMPERNQEDGDFTQVGTREARSFWYKRRERRMVSTIEPVDSRHLAQR